jgi:hypothetical protein
METYAQDLGVQRVAVEELAGVPHHRRQVSDAGVVADGLEELEELASFDGAGPVAVPVE